MTVIHRLTERLRVVGDGAGVAGTELVPHFVTVRDEFQSSQPMPSEPVAGYVTSAPLESMKEK